MGSIHQAERRHIAAGAAQPAHHRITAQPDELVDDAIARYDRAITDLDPSGEQGAARDYGAVANPAIVGHVRILHEEIVAADNSDLALFAAAMDGNAFAEDVGVANPYPSPATGIGDVLRLIANDHVRMQDVLRPQFGIA